MGICCNKIIEPKDTILEICSEHWNTTHTNTAYWNTTILFQNFNLQYSHPYNYNYTFAIGILSFSISFDS